MLYKGWPRIINAYYVESLFTYLEKFFKDEPSFLMEAAERICRDLAKISISILPAIYLCVVDFTL